jgi:hypothetical protein
MGIEMGPKRLDLVRQLVPAATSLAMLVNPTFPLGSAEARDVQASSAWPTMALSALFGRRKRKRKNTSPERNRSVSAALTLRLRRLWYWYFCLRLFKK